MSSVPVIPVAIHFPPELPVSRRREEIARAIAQHQVVIVAGETGSGKTTQLPKICLELGRTSIGHTQPRRIAARTIAERIAEELGQEVGGLVGYQVRFTDRVGADTRIKLMTDGILLNEIHRDRMLRSYDTIIIDEAHERSLNIDFLLGYLRQLLPQRPELKLIVTSATIDPQSFAEHFARPDGQPAPIVEVSGRTFPVEIRYRPLVAEEATDEDDDFAEGPDADAPTSTSRTIDPGAREASVDRDYLTGITDALDELARESDGDVLVFLSGENEIRDAEDAVRGHLTRTGVAATTEVLPLYGRLSAADQHRVFGRSGPGIRRRIVLATNVAETSLTVPGIRYVIDAGTARISRYSVRSKVQRLPIEAISQASAKQRSGRSGRTSDGIAIRLYSQEDFEKRPEFTEPEILRTNLAAVILQMIALDLGAIEDFPFLTPPDSRGIKDGMDLLTELGAVHATGLRPAKGSETIARGPSLTKIGRDLARLPIDPRFARMLVESKRHDTTREVMAIVAGLTIQDPRERPLERRAQADQQHARFVDPGSDFLTLLNLWNHLEQQQTELSSSAFRRMCKAEYLNYLRVREWQDVYRQLKRLAKPVGLRIGDARVDADGIHRSLLAGLLSHIGLRDAQKKDYVGARQTRFVIFPGSALAAKKKDAVQPQAVMSAELVETSRLFARTNAAIDPGWAEPIAGDLVKSSHSEPHWEKSQGAVVAYERVTLYGVPIVPRRRVQFTAIDPAYSRDLFIRNGLIEEDWPLDTRDHAFDFLRANRRLRGELEQLEERTRRRDILFDDETVFAFYERRIPADVATARTFEKWWRAERRENPELLTMTRADLIDEQDEPRIDQAQFPPVMQRGDQRLALTYRFEPGADDDGVTVNVPLALLPRLSPAGFDWQVPGLRAELVTALIRSLPKAIRRTVVPAADWAARIIAELPDAPAADDPEPFTAAVACAIKRLTGTRVDAGDFDLNRVPAHLLATFRVIDERGKSVATGKDLLDLQRRLAIKTRESVARVIERAADPIERSGLSAWDFDELPRFVDTEQGGRGTGMPRTVIRGYPALVDDGRAGDASPGTVSLQVLGTSDEQARALPAGVRRLLLNGVPSPVSYVQQHLTNAEKLALAASPYPSTKALFDDCLIAVVDGVLQRVAPGGQVFMRAEFESVRDRVSAAVMDSMFETVGLVARTLSASRTVEKALGSRADMTLLGALTDAREQLAGLVHRGFVSTTGLDQLRHLPRYLQALAWRLQKLPENPGRDRVWMTEVQTATARFTDAGGSIPLPAHSPARLVHARWMLEELRVSLFAQHLGTAETVSLQRIVKVLAG
ncbi:MAG TPA: ATP-dependent RNA helicase HrpA [Humibacter sp.]|nr:ATP-dependent RNA helicase HrpA [Humibacter sp.]